MQAYANLSRDSGVIAYEPARDHILVQFRTGKPYRYSYAKAGPVHVEEMKRLAVAGRGLSTYISRNVRDLYDDDV